MKWWPKLLNNNNTLQKQKHLAKFWKEATQKSLKIKKYSKKIGNTMFVTIPCQENIFQSH